MLFVNYRTFVMVFRYSYLVFVIRYYLFIFAIRYSLFICVIRSFFFRMTHFCAVTNQMLLHDLFVTEKCIRK